MAAGRELPPAANSYLEDDFVMNLLETVLDYMLHELDALKEFVARGGKSRAKP